MRGNVFFFKYDVISYSNYFVLTLVISYPMFCHFVNSNNHFVPGHFVPILVISYLDQMGTK